MDDFAVTTGSRPTPDTVRRARAVAERAELPYVPRRGSLRRTVGDRRAYVVRRDREELQGPEGTIHVHAGLTVQRLSRGVSHPLIAALAPSGRAIRIADGTLGLAGDALHIAAALDCDVLGYELSPLVFALLEDGLARLAVQAGPIGEAAARIDARHGDCLSGLRTLEEDAVDAVLLAPMYAAPDAAPPGYGAFRAAAAHHPLSDATVNEALRVAPRVVIKLRPGETPPPSLEARPRTVTRGKSVEYWTLDRP